MRAVEGGPGKHQAAEQCRPDSSPRPDVGHQGVTEVVVDVVCNWLAAKADLAGGKDHRSLRLVSRSAGRKASCIELSERRS
jgi:hypothetical protein